MSGSREDHLHAAESALERAWDEQRYLPEGRQVWAAVAVAEVALAAEIRAGSQMPSRCCPAESRFGQCCRPRGHEGLHNNASQQNWAT